jgi:hypothetical protein
MPKAHRHPDCLTCVSFFITHEPARPYGCRAMGFKSPQIPALAVFQSSGIECQAYRKKPGKPGPAKQ